MITAEEISRMTVQEVMTRWPETVQLFQRLHILCPGCPVSTFCTVQDAAVLHRQESLSQLVSQSVSRLADRLTD
jgi:hybrid cluster-associated redox disulfide protein